jgi:hypothetical protein
MRTALLVVSLCLAAAAADISGKWTAQVPGRQGVRDTTFVLKADGDKLTGTMNVEGQETPLVNGKVAGDTITFETTVERGGNTIKQTYTGKMAGNEIQFKREGGRGPAREFTAKRAQ